MLVNSYQEADLVVFEKMPGNSDGDEIGRDSYRFVTDYLDKLLSDSSLKTHIVKIPDNDVENKQLRDKLEAMCEPESTAESEKVDNVINEPVTNGVDEADKDDDVPIDPDLLPLRQEEYAAFFDSIRKQTAPPKSILFVVPDLRQIAIKAQNFITTVQEILQKKFETLPNCLSFLLFNNTENSPSAQDLLNLKDRHDTFETLKDRMSPVDIYDGSLNYGLRKAGFDRSIKGVKVLIPKLIQAILGIESPIYQTLVNNMAQELVKKAKFKVKKTALNLKEPDRIAIKEQVKQIQAAGLILTKQALQTLIVGRLGRELAVGTVKGLLKEFTQAKQERT